MSLADGQTDASASKLVPFVKSLEHAEDPFEGLRLDASPLSRTEKTQLLTPCRAAENDEWLITVLGAYDGDLDDGAATGQYLVTQPTGSEPRPRPRGNGLRRSLPGVRRPQLAHRGRLRAPSVVLECQRLCTWNTGVRKGAAFFRVPGALRSNGERLDLEAAWHPSCKRVRAREKLLAKMRQRHEIRRSKASSIVWYVAIAGCAGSETPAVSSELAAAVAVAYARQPAAPKDPDDDAASGGSSGEASSDAGSSGSGATVNAGGSGDVGAGGSGLSGGAGAPDSSSAGAAGSAEDPETCDGFAVLEANCGTSGCHGEGSNLGTYAESEEVARSYIGEPGIVCSTQGALIDTDDPSASLMVRKLSRDPPCGNPMPLNAQPLSAADAQCIEDWIGGLE